MDSTAISLIQQTAIDASSKRLPDWCGEVAAVIPEDYTIQSLECYSKGRFRFRGELSTHSVTDFVKYVREQGKGEGFIDDDKLSATVFFNLGTELDPGHADWTATLNLKATAAYKALIGIDGKTLRQRDIIDWLEDWSPFLQAFSQDCEEPVPLSTAIAAIRKLTIKATSETESTQGDFKESRSKFNEIEAKSSIGIPAGFLFSTNPYMGLPHRVFKVRLSVLTDSEVPRLVLRIVQREAQEESIALDFKSVLSRDLGEVVTLTIGTFETN